MASSSDYGEEAMMIDTTLLAAPASPSENDYFRSLHSHYPSRPFRLFDLPRELRDMIYDYALVDEATFKVGPPKSLPPTDPFQQDPTTTTPRPEDALDELPEEPDPHPALSSTVHHRPATNILLANSTLKSEYEDRARGAMRILLQDTERYAFQPFSLPPQAQQTRHLDAHLILFCHSCASMSHFDDKTCHAALELTQHHLWLHKLLPDLPHLRTLTLQAYISHDRYRSDSKQPVPCEAVVLAKFREMQDLRQASRLELCKYDYNAYPDLKGPKAVVYEWTARDGVVSAPTVCAPPPPPGKAGSDAMEVDGEEVS